MDKAKHKTNHVNSASFSDFWHLSILHYRQKKERFAEHTLGETVKLCS